MCLSVCVCVCVCPPLPSGRFRLVDDGNTPVGATEQIAFARSCPFLHPSLFILADVAYSQDSRCRTPYRAPELTVEIAGSAAEAARRRIYNQQLSSSRQKVEHAFSRVKHTFRQLQGTWTYSLSSLPLAFRAACLLCNWLARTRGLYRYN